MQIAILIILIIILVLLCFGIFIFLKKSTNNKQNNSNDNLLVDTSQKVSEIYNLFNNQVRGGKIVEQTLSTILTNQLGNTNNFETQKKIGDNKVIDFYIDMHNNGKGIGIDCKFPLDAYKKILSSDKFNLKENENNLKINIQRMYKELNNNYIKSNLLDFVIMFIPSESIYRYLCDADMFESLFNEASEQKIYLCSPTTISIMLYFFQKGIKDNWINSNTSLIIKTIYDLKNEFNRWNERYESFNNTINKLVDEHMQQLQITNKKINKKLELFTNKFIDENEIE